VTRRYLAPLLFVGAAACAPHPPTTTATAPALPQMAELQADTAWLTLSRQVEIRRTAYGVPHILADNVRAAGFAWGGSSSRTMATASWTD
jgi:acyl-homoserine lactone acylase PvdQ